MSEAITQCPACQTSFRVSAAQMLIADGSVRCGACLNIFRAERHLLSPPLDIVERLAIEQNYWLDFEQYLLQIGPPTVAETLTVSSDDTSTLAANPVSQAPDFHDEDLSDEIEEQDPEAGAADLEIGDATLAFQGSSAAVEGFGAEVEDFGAEVEDLIPVVEDSNREVEDSNRDVEGSGSDTDIEDANQAFIEYVWLHPFPVIDIRDAQTQPAGIEEREDQSSEDEVESAADGSLLQDRIDEVAGDQLTAEDLSGEHSSADAFEYGSLSHDAKFSSNDSPEPEAWLEGNPLDQPVDEATATLSGADDPGAIVSVVDTEQSTAAYPENDWEEYLNLTDSPPVLAVADKLNNIETGANDNDLLEDIEDFELPVAETPEIILDSERPRPINLSIQWLPGVALMLLALLTQYAFFSIDRYAQDPQYRPWYETACRTLGCHLPEYANVSELMTRDLVVRSHPERDGALLLDVLLLNIGPYRQQFPGLQLNFFDLNGSVVAARVFGVEEYLGGEMRGLKYIPAVTEVRISLALADPGADALGYEMVVVKP